MVSFYSNPQKRQCQRMLYCHTTALISQASKVMVKILQATLRQYVNCEYSDAQAGFRKGRGTRDQIANICWIIEKAREFQKNIYFCLIDYAQVFDCVDHNKLWKILEDGNARPHDVPLEKSVCRWKQQLELDLEQQTNSNFEKKYVKSVYCHSAYLTYMQSTS